MVCEFPGVLRPGSFQRLIKGQDIRYREDTRVGRPNCERVARADVFFQRLRCSISVIAAAACADLPSLSARLIEDDPASFVFSQPESRRFGFAARHDGLTILRMARGVVRSFPATLAISRVPTAVALRKDDNVNGPCGKNTATASTSVITSSSSHWAGLGRAFARASLSTLCFGMLGQGAHGLASPSAPPLVQGVCEFCVSGSLSLG